jgi:CAAX protease family protein
MHEGVLFGRRHVGVRARVALEAMPHAAPPRRSGFFSFFLTRLFLATVAFFGVWKLVDLGLFLVFGRAPSGIFDRAIATLAALLSMTIVGGIMEGRSIAELGFGLRNWLRELGLGAFVAAGLLTMIIGVMALCGWYQVNGLRWQQAGGDALMFAIFGLASYGLVAVLEEVLFRGMLLRIVEEALGTWIALAISALIFGGAHLLNDNASLWSAIAIAVESGILFGAAYILTRALWLPIGLHWAWNYFEGYVYGTPVSGAQQTGLLIASLSGPELWTGGAFGPEAGLVALMLSGTIGLILLVMCVRNGRVVTPAWLQWRGPGRELENGRI